MKQSLRLVVVSLRTTWRWKGGWWMWERWCQEREGWIEYSKGLNKHKFPAKTKHCICGKSTYLEVSILQAFLWRWRMLTIFTETTCGRYKRKVFSERKLSMDSKKTSEWLVMFWRIWNPSPRKESLHSGRLVTECNWKPQITFQTTCQGYMYPRIQMIWQNYITDL